MSLVSTLVRGKDGLFYKNPTLSGKGWFICFDDDDPCELVIKLSAKLKPQDIFDSIGLKVSNIRKNGVSGRMFGKRFKFDDAYSYWFDIKSNIDPKYITEHDGKVEEIVGDCVYYDPEHE